MNILKFGGTSMTDHQTWSRVLKIIDESEHPVVVVSATARTTRQLFQAARLAANGSFTEADQIAKDIHRRHHAIVNGFAKEVGCRNSNLIDDCIIWNDDLYSELTVYLKKISESNSLSLQAADSVASIGERISSYLLAKCGEMAGLPSRYVDARDVLKTNSEFGSAIPLTEIIDQKTNLIADLVDNGKIPVMGGYYGENELGEITTLGFEGSDYSASLLGSALNAKSVVIWTDVSGIYTCDPRIIPDAKPIPELSFREATELAFFGAKVLHPSTLKPVANKSIPVYVKNLFHPGDKGTKIYDYAERNGPARALTYRESNVIITVTASDYLKGYQFLSRVFETFESFHRPVDVVNTTEDSVIISLEDHDDLVSLCHQLEKFGDVKKETGKGQVSIIGFASYRFSEIQKNVLDAIQDVPIDMVSYSKSRRHLSIVMARKHVVPATRAIHKLLFTHQNHR